MRYRTAAVWALIAACGVTTTTFAAQAQRNRRNAAAAAMVNPIPVDDSSLDLGRRIYFGECAACHGELGDGDSKMQYSLDPVPPSLVDDEWQHGSTDGEMFVVVRDGIDNTSMKPYADLLTEPQIWSVINYVRSLAPETPQH